MKTKLDLHNAAIDFVRETLAEESPRVIDAAIPQRAAELNIGGADYLDFRQRVGALRQTFLSLATLPTAAEKEAQRQAAAPKPTQPAT